MKNNNNNNNYYTFFLIPFKTQVILKPQPYKEMLFEAFFSVAEPQKKKSYGFRFTVIVINRYKIQKQTFLAIT